MQKTDEQTTNSLLDGWNAPPNLVTYARIALVVVFLVLDIMAGPYGVDNPTLRWVAAIIFIIAASTDKIDGWMARRYNQVTEMGKLMDPIADKLLTCGALVVAAAFGEFGNVAWGWIVVALFLIRELGITVMRFFVMEQPGGKVIAAAWPGKAQDRVPVRGPVPAAGAAVDARARHRSESVVADGVHVAHADRDLCGAGAVPVFRRHLPDQHLP